MDSKTKLQQAMQHALANHPKVGGFPYLAECLRLAGATHNIWSLPSLLSIYMIEGKWVVNQGIPLVSGMVEVELFDEEALKEALRLNQVGKSTFPEFLQAIWDAGVVSYDVDFNTRTVAYMGSNGDIYSEDYPAVEVTGFIL